MIKQLNECKSLLRLTPDNFSGMFSKAFKDTIFEEEVCAYKVIWPESKPPYILSEQDLIILYNYNFSHRYRGDISLFRVHFKNEKIMYLLEEKKTEDIMNSLPVPIQDLIMFNLDILSN